MKPFLSYKNDLIRPFGAGLSEYMLCCCCLLGPQDLVPGYRQPEALVTPRKLLHSTMSYFNLLDFRRGHSSRCGHTSSLFYDNELQKFVKFPETNFEVWPDWESNPRPPDHNNNKCLSHESYALTATAIRTKLMLCCISYFEYFFSNQNKTLIHSFYTHNSCYVIGR